MVNREYFQCKNFSFSAILPRPARSRPDPRPAKAHRAPGADERRASGAAPGCDRCLMWDSRGREDPATDVAGSPGRPRAGPATSVAGSSRPNDIIRRFISRSGMASTSSASCDSWRRLRRGRQPPDASVMTRRIGPPASPRARAGRTGGRGGGRRGGHRQRTREAVRRPDEGSARAASRGGDGRVGIDPEPITDPWADRTRPLGLRSGR
jgi:hypothetical protein